MRPIRHAPLLLVLVAGACSRNDGPTAAVRLPPSLTADVAVCTADCTFGPVTFTRGSGSPITETRSFSATPGSNYSIDIDDLATQGADGSVTLNGQLLMQLRATTGEVGPRHITIDVTLLATNVLEVRLVGRKGSQLQITVTRKYECFPDLPAPQLSLETVTPVGGAFPGTRYELDVPNYASFPDLLFASAPDLPPCGSNTSAPRSWLDMYATDLVNPANDSYLFGFCSFHAASDMNEAWVFIPAGTTPPPAIYITLTDRRCGIVYKSNTISLQ